MLSISLGLMMFPVVMTPSHDGKIFSQLHALFAQFGVVCGATRPVPQVSLQRGESLITRARTMLRPIFGQPAMDAFILDRFRYRFSPQAVYRLLLSDYDAACGVYPLKHENWPQEGLPQGTTQAQFEAGYNHYTVNTGAVESDNGEVPAYRCRRFFRSG